MTHSIVLDLPEEIYHLLLETSKQNGKKAEEFAIEILAGLKREKQFDPLEKFIGAFTCDIPDLAENHDKYIGENLAQDLKVQAK